MAEKVAGQSITPERIAKARAALDPKIAEHLVEEADDAAQEMLNMFTNLWGDKSFTKEQAVFSVALMTIHLRNTYPDGKDKFDDVAADAAEYYKLKLG